MSIFVRYGDKELGIFGGGYIKGLSEVRFKASTVVVKRKTTGRAVAFGGFYLLMGDISG